MRRRQGLVGRCPAAATGAVDSVNSGSPSNRDDLAFGVVEAAEHGEAIASDAAPTLGLLKLQRLAYSVLRPHVVARSAVGMTVPSVAEYESHFTRRFKSLDGHLFQNGHVGPHIGYTHSLVGFLAEICAPGSLEFVETRVRNTVTVHAPLAVPGRPTEAPREIATDPAAVRRTVELANDWVRAVKSGQTAGVGPQIEADEDGAFSRAGLLVAGGLLLVAPGNAVTGLRRAVRPRLLQSHKIQDLNFAVERAVIEAQDLAPLF